MESPQLKDEFYPLRYLVVERQLEVSVLATAIEQQGVYGFDRFGRFKHAAGTSSEAARALDALAAQYKTSADPEVPYALDTAAWEAVFDNYGWPASNLPSFESLIVDDAVAPPRPNLERRSKSDGNQLRLIGGLLRFIKGDYGKPHPEYESEARLQELLRLKIDRPGLSARHLQDVFKRSQQALDEADIT